MFGGELVGDGGVSEEESGEEDEVGEDGAEDNLEDDGEGESEDKDESDVEKPSEGGRAGALAGTVATVSGAPAPDAAEHIQSHTSQERGASTSLATIYTRLQARWRMPRRGRGR
jgi:hypothetical protein